MGNYIIQSETLENIADAIRFKTTTDQTIDANQMSEKIKKINNVEIIGGNINGYPNSGILVENGYTHSIEDIENDLENNHCSRVCKYFKPDDDCIHLIINKTSSLNGFGFEFYQNNGNSVTVDWGDGSEPELSGTTAGSSSLYHEYSNSPNGYYDIKIAENVPSSSFSFKQTIPSGWGNEMPTPDQLALIAVYFPDTNTTFSNYILNKDGGFFRSEGLINIVFPKTIANMGKRIFERCYKIEYAILPNNITSVPEKTFMYCHNLKFVYIPNTVTSIRSSAFCQCIKLNNIILPKNLTYIESSSFQDCENLTNIVIPEAVQNIGSQAFYGCSSLKEVHVKPISPPSLGTNVFDDTSRNIKIYVPYSSDHSILNVYKTKTNWRLYANEIVEEPAP